MEHEKIYRQRDKMEAQNSDFTTEECSGDTPMSKWAGEGEGFDTAQKKSPRRKGGRVAQPPKNDEAADKEEKQKGRLEFLAT